MRYSLTTSICLSITRLVKPSIATPAAPKADQLNSQLSAISYQPSEPVVSSLRPQAELLNHFFKLCAEHIDLTS